MISYEKIRQSLRSWTLFIAWINVLAAVLKVLSVAYYFYLVANLESIRSNLDEASYQIILATTNISNLLLVLFGLAANASIAFLSFKNLSNIKEDTPSLLPYQIAFAYTIAYNLLSIAISWALGFTVSITATAVLLPLVFLALYGSTYYQATRLLKKEENPE